MKRTNWLSIPFFCAAVTLSLTAYAATSDSTEASKTEAAEEAKPDSDKKLKEKKSVTAHTIKIGGKEIQYTATAGNLILKKDAEDKDIASVFYVAYTKDKENPSQRPITFVTNGGPGSSAVWLHMGVFGPRRVELDDNGYAHPPYSLVDNTQSILDVTDLVFIDPIPSGYSQAAPGEDVKQFYGVEEDVKYLAEFIRQFLSRHKRWESPKFFAGESYGTTRAAALAQQLHDHEHIYLNGIVLISTVLNFQTHNFASGNDLPYLLYLPSYTAAAYHHGRLPKDLQQRPLKEVLAEVENFVDTTYNVGLMRGDALPDNERAELVRQLSRYTGLDETYVERANARLHLFRFVKELLRDQKRTIGRFDSRIKGIDSDAAGEMFEYDPAADAIFGAFAATWNHYVLTELEWDSERKYEIIASVYYDWNWSWNKESGISIGKKQGYVNVADSLRSVMTRNPKLKVFVANGYHDLATPYYAAKYTIDHLGLDPSLRGNVTMVDYEGGHMMYNHKPTLKKMKEDLATFIQNASK